MTTLHHIPSTIERPASNDVLLTLCRARNDESMTLESLYEVLDRIGIDTLSEYAQEVAVEAVLLKIEASVDDFVRPAEIAISILALQFDSIAMDGTITTKLREASARYPGMVNLDSLHKAYGKILRVRGVDEMN